MVHFGISDNIYSQYFLAYLSKSLPKVIKLLHDSDYNIQQVPPFVSATHRMSIVLYTDYKSKIFSST